MRERDGAVAPAEIPRAVDVVFRAGADDGGLRFIVDENHVVAFAEPVVGVLQDAQGDAHQMAAPARFGEDVVVLAVGIQFLLAGGERVRPYWASAAGTARGSRAMSSGSDGTSW